MDDTTANAAPAKAKPARRPTRAARARSTVESSVKRTRETLNDGVSALRTQAEQTVEAGASAIDGSPLAAIAGAIAVGAAIGALVPATRQERAAIGPVGERIRTALDTSFNAAKAAGAEQLTTRGLTSTALSSGLSGILMSIIQASLAGSSAARAAPSNPATLPKS